MPILFNQETESWDISLTEMEKKKLEYLLIILFKEYNQNFVVVDPDNVINNFIDIRYLDNDSFFKGQ